MTLDALKSVKLRKSKKKVVSPSKRKKPDRASPKVGPARFQFVAENEEGLLSNCCVVEGGVCCKTRSLKHLFLLLFVDGIQVLFQLKKTSRSVPRSPGGTPLLSKKKRRMSILGSFHAHACHSVL